MADEEKPLLSRLWPNKGIDWTIMIVMAIALLCGALFSGLVGATLAWATGQADLAAGWKALAGVIGYGSALALGVLTGRTLDRRTRRRVSPHPSPLPQAGEGRKSEVGSKSPLPPAGEG